MGVKVTVRKLRDRRNLDGSNFLNLYEKLTLEQQMSSGEYENILAFAVIFLREGDETVQKLGYRIILQYSLTTMDFAPLIAIADHREMMPILATLRRVHPDAFDPAALKDLISQAHATNFLQQDITWTREQLALQAFNQSHGESVIIAPTSYGKSQMLIDRALGALPNAVCILVPSKALIAQTKADVVKASEGRQSQTPRIITHPEAYNDEASFLGILTQERLHRLFVDNPSLKLRHLLIDEAQNLLSSDARALQLSQVILIARSRNPELELAYYTPFLEEPTALAHVHNADDNVKSRAVNETVKVERFYVGEVGGSLALFDQFLLRTFNTDQYLPRDPAEAILTLGGRRTIVYLNRPRDAQRLAMKLSAKVEAPELSPTAEIAIQAISDLIDPDYSLVDAIKRGVLYHHGQIPEVIRQYVENLFREDQTPQKRYLVTTSTLLEGVNTPADTLILMAPGKGLGHLRRSSFRNLVGRVARFSELFDDQQPRLDLLLPKIFLIKSRYSPSNWSPTKWLADKADPNKSAADQVENPLLVDGPADQPRIEALERLENIEDGSSGLTDVRRTNTEVGKLCFLHGAHDFDIFRHERLLQNRLDALDNVVVSSPNDLIDLIVRIFLRGVELEGQVSDDLIRIRDSESVRKFYAKFLTWRAEGSAIKRMIASYVNYWHSQESDWIWVGSRWGDAKRSQNEHAYAFIRRSQKTRAELVNFAIVRIKAELDFLDYHLMKYLEILFASDLVEENFYLKLKYGTNDRRVIAMLRNGFSLELAKLIGEHYLSLVTIDVAANTVRLDEALYPLMQSEDVNDILLFEMRGLLGVW